LPKEYVDIKMSDHIIWTDFFAEENRLKVMSRDYIDFSLTEPYIELTCLKI
jgi:hypothetical protein